MLSKTSNVIVQPKTTEERLKAILARPRNPYAKIRLAMPKYQAQIKEVK